MKLENGELAIVDIAKLRDYCLNAAHPRGRHKARMFASLLDLRQEDAEWLRQRLLEAARSAEAVRVDEDKYGSRFTVDFEIQRQGKSATVRSGWILRKNESAPRLTSCYVILD